MAILKRTSTKTIFLLKILVLFKRTLVGAGSIKNSFSNTEFEFGSLSIGSRWNKYFHFLILCITVSICIELLIQLLWMYVFVAQYFLMWYNTSSTYIPMEKIQLTFLYQSGQT